MGAQQLVENGGGGTTVNNVCMGDMTWFPYIKQTFWRLFFLKKFKYVVSSLWFPKISN